MAIIKTKSVIPTFNTVCVSRCVCERDRDRETLRERVESKCVREEREKLRFAVVNCNLLRYEVNKNM